MIKDILSAVVDALHEVNIISFCLDWQGDFMEVTLLAVGWGSLLVFVVDGRPALGAQYCHGLSLWAGPFFKRV